MTTDPAASLPERVETVLLDAGGVLLQLDYAYLRRLIETRHREVTDLELLRAEASARGEIHRHVEDGGLASDAWRDYFHMVLGSVGVPAADHEAMIDSLWEANRRAGLWTVPAEGGTETVRELKRQGYRLGVVSNAEGRVAQQLDAAGYEGLFDEVVDSALVGVEKPDAEIFLIALHRLEASAESTVFIGDVPGVDVAGAQAAQLTPILLDPFDLFAEWQVTRLRTIGELPGCLARTGKP